MAATTKTPCRPPSRSTNEEKSVCKSKCRDYAADGTRQLYDLFAASPTRYGLITYQPNSETIRPVRFQLLLGNGLTKGITLNSSPGYYRFTSDCILNRRYDGETQFVDQYYFEGDLISSTPIPLDLSGPYAYTVLPDKHTRLCSRL